MRRNKKRFIEVERDEKEEERTDRNRNKQTGKRIDE
jgi:hypothetical protein